MYRNSLETIIGLVAHENVKTLTAKNLAIAIATSKDFLDTILIYYETWIKWDNMWRCVREYYE